MLTFALATTAFAQAATAQTPTQAEREIRDQRAAFNRAIATNDIAGIGAVLADNVQLVTGTDSKVVAGKQAQLAIWAGDPGDASHLIYIRTPDRISVSPLLPIAMEFGHWRGAPASSAKDWVGGDDAAKWRRINDAWRIETETYMTTGCGGSVCPKAGLRSGRGIRSLRQPSMLDRFLAAERFQSYSPTISLPAECTLEPALRAWA